MFPVRPQKTPWTIAFAAATACFVLALPCHSPKFEFDSRPTADVIDHMAKHRRAELSAMFSVCVGPDGRAESIHLVKTSGYPDYDERLLSRIQRTRFARVDCFIETFRFVR